MSNEDFRGASGNRAKFDSNLHSNGVGTVTPTPLQAVRNATGKLRAHQNGSKPAIASNSKLQRSSPIAALSIHLAAPSKAPSPSMAPIKPTPRSTSLYLNPNGIQTKPPATVGMTRPRIGPCAPINSRTPSVQAPKTSKPNIQSRNLQTTYGTKRAIINSVCGMVTLLGIVGIFLPSQVLLLGLLFGLGAILVGALSFTSRASARVVTVASGLLCLAASIYGLIAIGRITANKATRSEISAQAGEINTLLAKNCIFEAELRIGAIEHGAIKLNSDPLNNSAKAAVGELRGLVDGWIQQHFGQISESDRKLLISLYHHFGSLTPSTQLPRIVSFSVSKANTLAVTFSTDTRKPGWTRATDDGQISADGHGDPVEGEANRIFLYILKEFENVQAVELKLVSTSKEGEELFCRTLDLQGLLNLRRSLSAKPLQRIRPSDEVGPPRIIP